MYLCELYKSIQGEGLLTGQESIFIRTSGCNLRCGFCDADYSSWNPEGFRKPVEEILDECQKLSCKHVVITGGEPMLQAGIVPLTGRLHEEGFHITIETAGTVFRHVCCNLMSISPKLSNSTPPEERAGKWSERHEQTRHNPDVIRALIRDHEYQMKFVIDDPDDFDELAEYLNEFPELKRDRVLLMPQGTSQQQLTARGEWILPFCEQEGFVFCPRKQIEWFGHTRGT